MASFEWDLVRKRSPPTAQAPSLKVAGTAPSFRVPSPVAALGNPPPASFLVSLEKSAIHPSWTWVSHHRCALKRRLRLLTINQSVLWREPSPTFPLQCHQSLVDLCVVPAECLPPPLCLPKFRSSSQAILDHENALLAHPYSWAHTELNYTQSHSIIAHMCVSCLSNSLWIECVC